MQAIMDHAFERYFRTSGLFGTPDMCLEMTDRLSDLGVDEIACLIDFGVDADAVLDGLRYLDEVRRRSDPANEQGDYSIPGQLRRHQVTHFQCTPSLARVLAADADSLDALRPLRKVLVGGEALPPDLARRLTPNLDGDLINVYGPTETTVWSTAAVIDRSGGPVTIGRPLANTQVYVLDPRRRPVPVGVPGELYIGGDGVAQGYLQPPRFDRRAFRAGPVSSGPGPPLPHRRPGPLSRGRTARIPGAAGQSGQGARPPHRAGRDRGRAGGPPRRPRERRGGPGRRRAAAASWPTWRRPNRRRRATGHDAQWRDFWDIIHPRRPRGGSRPGTRP